MRWRVRVRWATAPLALVTDALPADGRILDWGCGHGLVALAAADGAPGRTISGADIDRDKVEVARAAARAGRVDDRVTFEVVGPDQAPTGSWDAVVLCDLLYLQGPDDQAQLVRAAAAAVAPGGALLVKELAERPRWKWALSRTQEQISVRLLRITEVGTGFGRSPSEHQIRAWMEASGLIVEERRADRGYHTPHILLIGRRTADRSAGVADAADTLSS